MPAHPEWTRPLWDAALDLDWLGVGGDWNRYFGAEIRRRTSATLRGTRCPPLPGQEVRPWMEYRLQGNGIEFRSWVRLLPQHPTGLEVLLCGRGEPVPEEEALWREAIEQACHNSQRDLIPFSWQAVLRSPYTHAVMPTPGSFGPIAVSLGDSVHRGRGNFGPLYLDGVTTGSAWTTARLHARRDTRVIASLLSLAWDRHVDLEVEPLAKSEQEWAHLEPADWSRTFFSDGAPPPARTLALPAWSDRAWERVHASTDLFRGIIGYHEALQLHSAKHPSFAYAALAATIEAVGAMEVDLSEKCPECGQRTGAYKRFRAALSRIVKRDSDEYKRAYKGYADYRSTTVHSATLHGGEQAIGGSMVSGNPFVVSSGESFVNEELPEMRAIARRVLLHAVTSEDSS